MDLTNAYDYRTSLSQIVKDVHTFSKNIDVEYTSFLEEHHVLARSKKEVAFWEESLAKQKENMSGNRKL